jgi:succinyl-CoA synthetase alpha subunit
MSVLANRDTRLLVQGMGRHGSFHAARCQEYGKAQGIERQVVAGVTPGKGGTQVDGIPLFNTVDQAVRETGANASLIFVPGPFAADAILETIDAGLRLAVCITEGIPSLDMLSVHRALTGGATRLIGPNCPGVISPGQCKVGIMPGHIHREGEVGVVSRSGTLTYEVVAQLTALGIGQSTCMGIGGDPIIGTSFVDALKLLAQDSKTTAVCLIGEIGGGAEEEAAEFIRAGGFKKPVVAFIAGQTAPPGRRMGHAGAIISGGKGTAAAKVAALEAAGASLCRSPADMGETMAKILGR